MKAIVFCLYERKQYLSLFAGSLILFLLIGLTSVAQITGNSSFRFLETPASARMAGLGGVNVSLADRDLNFFMANPALNGDTLSGLASASYQFYVADIGHASISYAHPFSKVGMVTFGIQHMNYGTIQGYDASGAETDEFNASETALLISKSHQIGNFRLGASFKSVFSSLAAYRSVALAFDVGGIFVHPKEQLTVGMVIRNAGVTVSSYSSDANQRLPFDVQLGSTFKPQHMPLRFSLTAYNLKKNIVDADVNGTVDENSFVEELIGHLNVGTEVLLHRNFNLLFGYNFLNHKSLKLESGGGGAGISLGISATVKMFDFAVSRTGYMAGNAAYSFTLSGNINRYFKKR